MQICWDILNKEIRQENPIYRRSLGTIFKTPRGRSGKPRTLSLEDYKNAQHERDDQTRDLPYPRIDGGNG